MEQHNAFQPQTSKFMTKFWPLDLGANHRVREPLFTNLNGTGVAEMVWKHSSFVSYQEIMSNYVIPKSFKCVKNLIERQ